MIEGNRPRLTKNKGMFDRIFKFPYISRPVIIQKILHGAGRNPADLFSSYKILSVYEMLYQKRDMDGKHLKPVVEIFPEVSLPYKGIEISMRGGDNTDIKQPFPVVF